MRTKSATQQTNHAIASDNPRRANGDLLRVRKLFVHANGDGGSDGDQHRRRDRASPVHAPLDVRVTRATRAVFDCGKVAATRHPGA
jgi:hypothetical protein